jgi:hypothetical protein
MASPEGNGKGGIKKMPVGLPNWVLSYFSVFFKNPRKTSFSFRGFLKGF